LSSTQPTQAIRRFALLGHARDLRHAYDTLSWKLDRQESFSETCALGLLDQTEPFISDFWDSFITDDRVRLSGAHIIVPISPEYIRKKPHSSLDKINKAVLAAAAAGADVVTLGGLTSILFRDRPSDMAHLKGLAITSGNSLTAAVTVRMLKQAAELAGRDLAGSTLTILGASGDIGAACAQGLVGSIGRLVINGRNRSKLGELEIRLRKAKRVTPIECSLDMVKAVAEADFVIAATSTPGLPLQSHHFKPGAIVCDVGYPRNIDQSTRFCNGVQVFDGGLVSLPCPLESSWDLGLPDPFTCFGCYAEAMVLALEGRPENCPSIHERIDLEAMERIFSLAQKHGFREARAEHAASSQRPCERRDCPPKGFSGLDGHGISGPPG
jgi:predicted amino acid dehydrogenase